MTPERWQQIKPIFQSAIEHPPAERASYLNQACVSNPSLRGEVEALIFAHERAGDDFAVLGAAVAATMLRDTAAGSMIDHRLGPYQIIRQIGRGGMGSVYLARDSRLGRKVALKLLPAQFTTDAERVRRFEQEARAAAAINHPNVATIYDIGEHDGAIFIAMEYVEGETLAAKINGHPLAAAEIVESGLQVADALDEAHAKGVTHRDIKPANLMLTPRGQIKVLDFGLAKITRPERQAVASDISAVSITETGVVMGTASYMSPEQALGQEVDHRSDIFSLGVVLYEMTTGRRPFAGMSATEIIDRILHAQPEPLVRFNERAPAELERIVNRCIAKQRERRYQSAGELLLDLRQLRRELASGQVELKARPAKPAGRRGFIIALALLLSLASVLAFWFVSRARQTGQRAAAERLYREGRQFWNQRTVAGFRQALTCFEQATAHDPQYAPPWAGLADSWSLLAEYDFTPTAEAYPQAKAAALRALALDANLAEAHATLGTIKFHYEWDWRGAEDSFRQALVANPNYATAHQWYAEYLAGRGRFTEALAEIRRAQQLDPDSLIIAAVEGWVLLFARDYDGVITQAQRVIARNPDFAEVYSYLGLAYEQKGLYRQAMDAYERRSTLMGDNTAAASALRTAPVRDAQDFWRKRLQLEEVKLDGSPYDAAEALAQLNEPERAIALLEQSCEQRYARIAHLKVNPNFDTLRHHPRFQALLRRVRLAP